MSRELWEQRYADTQQYAYGTAPNAFLLSPQHYLDACMRALAVADGEGRNGVWLAQQGMDVLAVDFSENGLAKARALAKNCDVRLRTECVDITTWDWPQESFELVVSIFLHLPTAQRQAVHRAMYAALVPGGILILEAFHPDQLRYQTGGPSDVTMLYTLEMLQQDFADAEILLAEETVAILEEGQYHWGYAALTRLVLSKNA
jgi:SAM-dependent methyltransferase